MKSRFHEAAEVELAEAVEYYDFATEGRGKSVAQRGDLGG
jgi:hypothetical protein